MLNIKINRLNAATALAWLVLAGVAQYAIPAISQTISGRVAYWIIETDESSGNIFFYIKDITTVLFDIYWPIKVIRDRRSASHMNIYLFWIAVVLMFGLIPYFTGNGNPPFLIPGIRWLLFVHAAFGIYFISKYITISYADILLVSFVLFVVCFLNAAISVVQAYYSGALFNLAGARLPGILSNAGTAGYFALGMALIVRSFPQAPVNSRIILYFLCFLGAMFSGTRYAMLSIFVLAGVDIASIVIKKVHSRSRASLMVLAALIVGGAGIGVFNAVIEVADRGNPFDQGGEGGRLSNTVDAIYLVASSDFFEMLLGHGIGIATNGAFSIASTMGVNSKNIEWNMLTDVTFAASILQFGLLGVVVFVVPLTLFSLFQIRYKSIDVALIFFLGMITQNMPEQYFLLIGFFCFWGMQGCVLGAKERGSDRV